MSTDMSALTPHLQDASNMTSDMTSSNMASNMDTVDDEDEQLRKAIELSKQTNQQQTSSSGSSGPFGDDGGGKVPAGNLVRFDESNLSQANDQFNDDIAKAIAMSMSDSSPASGFGVGGAPTHGGPAEALGAKEEDNEARPTNFVEPQAHLGRVRATPEERKARIMAPYTPEARCGTGAEGEGGEGGCGVKLVLRRDSSAASPASGGSDFPYRSESMWEEKDLESSVTSFLLSSGGAALGEYKAPYGILLLCMSLVASRGPSQIAADMDYPPPDCAFTAQFGHCSQELINLLLAGAATSNVFDGVMDMGGLLMRGVPRRTRVGYLTQIEALRYVQVGTYYKTPQFPLWVVGSQSHFTVLFSLTMKPIEESASDQILEQCRRAFRVIDGDGAGFIQMTSLRELLALLGLAEAVGDADLTRLANELEECDAGIILWDKFWRKVSRLMTGASIESVLDPSTSPGGAAEAKFEVERFADSFSMHHFNGLREGRMAAFGGTRGGGED
ncbi:hypothetical protein TrRE_jg11205 [Triparma retinervis]|uniref:ubiquitinyl hydrolase 1 n=1 Tax=Triparma retinervis TaxID=2557542 RepID=A0A9W7CHP5_9STRA|nr:hypothetical protein TrRE_jg11205 [Triparma retinervis]